MDTLETETSVAADHHAEAMPISLQQYVAAVLQRRRLVALIIGVGFLLSVALALLLPNEYTSTAQLMPPDSRAFSSTSALSALAGTGLLANNGFPSILNQRSPAGTAIGILSSRIVQDAIIGRFNLCRVYHLKYYGEARKELERRSAFTEDKKSGIFTIAVTDRDQHRARDIAQDYIDQLNQITNQLSTSSARRERVFLGQEITSIKRQLDASTQQLAQFSSRNATLDMQKQGEATVESVNKLQGELISAEGELSALKAAYTDNNMRVREARGRIVELQAQLRKISGSGKEIGDAGSKIDQPLPSARQLPLLGVTYYDLYSQVTMQEATFELMNKQYELAKVEEAKELPSIQVLSTPDVPEKKSSPHRLYLVIVGILMSAVVGILWIVGSKFWDSTDNSHPVKAAVVEIMQWKSHRPA